MTDGSESRSRDDSEDSYASELSDEIPVPRLNNSDHRESAVDSADQSDCAGVPLPSPRPADDARDTSQATVVGDQRDSYRNWPEIDGYVLREFLGQGGFGRVFRAMSIRLNADVAIKVVGERDTGGLDIARRFALEVSNAARSGDLHVVRVLDSGQATDCDGQILFFLAMEYLPGGDFHSWLKRNPRTGTACPNLRSAIAGLVKICNSVESLHEVGIIHRDLKPANILLDAKGNPKLGDFGLSGRVAAEAGTPQSPSAGGHLQRDDLMHSRLTAAGEVLGTLTYLAPELLTGMQTARPETDQYSLGVILYQILSGVRPQQDQPGDRRERQRILVLRDLVSRGKPVPEVEPPSRKPAAQIRSRGLELICLRSLRQNPAERYASVSAMREDLQRWLDGEIISDRWLVGQWNRLVHVPVRKQPLRLLFNVISAMALILGMIAYAFSLDPRAVQLEQKLAAQKKSADRLAQELELVRGSDRELRQLILRTFRSIRQLTLESVTSDSRAGVAFVDRGRLLAELAQACGDLVSLSSSADQRESLFREGLSRHASFLYRTDELKTAEGLAELLWDLCLEELPVQTRSDADVTGESLTICELLVEIAIDQGQMQNLSTAEEKLRELQQRFAPDQQIDRESRIIQAQLQYLHGRLLYAKYAAEGQRTLLSEAATAVRSALMNWQEVKDLNSDEWVAYDVGRATVFLSLILYKLGDREQSIELSDHAMQLLEEIQFDQHSSALARAVQDVFELMMERLEPGNRDPAAAVELIGRRLSDMQPAQIKAEDAILRDNPVKVPEILVGMMQRGSGRRRRFLRSVGDIHEFRRQIDDQLLLRLVREQQIRVCFNTIMSLRSVGRFAEARQLGEQGLEYCRMLMERFPLEVRYRQEYARGSGNLADMYVAWFEHQHDTTILEQARNRQRDSAESYADVFADDQNRLEARSDAVKHYLRLTVEEVALGNSTAAANAVRTALKLATTGTPTTLMGVEESSVNALGIVLGVALLQPKSTSIPNDSGNLQRNQAARVWTEFHKFCGDREQISGLVKALLDDSDSQYLLTAVRQHADIEAALLRLWRIPKPADTPAAGNATETDGDH